MDLGQRIARLTPEQRKLLEKKLKQQNIDILKIPITRESKENNKNFPLSFGQERLWFIQQLEPDNFAYNLVRATKLEGRLDKKALQQSIGEIIHRHAVLRTIFIFDKQKPCQVILNQLSLSLETIDLKALPKEQQDHEVMQVIQDDSRCPFDLKEGPLLRTKLLQLSEDEHVFVLVIHHIIADGTSIQIFIRELAELYEVFSHRKESSLPELPIQYVDFAMWQRRWFGEDALEIGFRKKQETFWLDQFRGEIPVLTLPYDYPRPVIQTFEGNTLTFNVDIPESEALKKMALMEKTTLYVVLLSIFNIFLSKLSGSEDIIVGTPVSGRRHPDIQNLLGMFVNTLALRNSAGQQRSYEDFLDEVTEHTLNAFENQEYRYEDIIGRVNVSRDTSRNPLFDIMFLFKNVDYAVVDIPGLTLRHYEYESNTSKFDLTLNAWEANNKLYFSFEYCTKLFKQDTIERFIGYFRQLVRSLVADSNIKISDIDILPVEEKKRILYDFNNTGADYPGEKTLDELFEDQVRVSPDSIALTGASLYGQPGISCALTYGHLMERVNRLGRLLRTRGMKPGTIVGIVTERTLEMMTAIFAVLKAGAAYLPMDPGHPEKRIIYMLKESVARIVLTDNRLLPADEFELLDLNDVEHCPADQSILEPVTSAREPAYVIYTSGTTGIPKGVVIEHRAVVNFIKGMTDIIDFNVNDTLLSLTTLSFDIFGLETIVPLTQGTRVVIGTREEQLNPLAAALVIEKERVTIFQLTPSRLQLFVSQPGCARTLSLLRCLLVGGEAFPQKLLEHAAVFLNKAGGKIYNLYGPTETTIWSSSKDLSPEISINIGKPIVNTVVYILDTHLKPVPIGVSGEIYIGGDGVGRGYLNNPELTTARFIMYQPDYLQGTTPLRIYRTGDLGRWLPDGDIDCLGRIDHQVKIRGFRIELEEIESRLNSHEAVSEAVVIAKDDDQASKFLSAFYVPANFGNELSAAELREFLSEVLPDYMIPSYFTPLESIPLTPNKKVDRQALVQHEGFRPQPGMGHIAPQTDIEKKIAGCWMEVLKLPDVGIYDNFFELGGNSMNIIQLNSLLKDELSRDISVVSMFRYLTISSFAHYIMEEERGSTSESIKQRQEALHRAKKLFKTTIDQTMRIRNAREK